jgi:hypothetical protein
MTVHSSIQSNHCIPESHCILLGLLITMQDGAPPYVQEDPWFNRQVPYVFIVGTGSLNPQMEQIFELWPVNGDTA